MTSLSFYTEENLRRYVYDYWENSLSFSDSESIRKISYDIKDRNAHYYEGTFGGMGAGAAAGAATGAAIGSIVPGLGTLIGGIVGGFVGAPVGLGTGYGVSQAIPERKGQTKFFDKNSGDYLGETPNEAARKAIIKGKEKFINYDFNKALEQFRGAYAVSTYGSSEDQESKKLKNITDNFLTGVNYFNSGKYNEARSFINSAYSEANSDMKILIGRKRNEFAEKINENAIKKFEQGDWSKAEEYFNEAYYMCLDGYINESNFKNHKNIAARLNKITSNNAIEILIEVLKITENQKMRQILIQNITKAKKVAAEKYFIEAKLNWDLGWKAELDSRSSEATQKFTKAKQLFTQASDFDSQKSIYRNWIAISSLKLSGNIDFNEGIKLQMEGEELRSQRKLKEAKIKYSLAKGKFTEGLNKSNDQRFQISIDIVQGQINEIVETGINVETKEKETAEEDDRRFDIDSTIEHD